MLKKIKSRFHNKKKIILKNTMGEQVRDQLIKTGLKVAEGNPTERLVDVASKAGTVVDRITEAKQVLR